MATVQATPALAVALGLRAPQPEATESTTAASDATNANANTTATPTPPPSAAPAEHKPSPHRIWHCGWLLPITLVLSLASAVSLGITRFAYGLLLPPMQKDLNWTYALAGGMNTANAGGYLIGALTASWVMRRWGAPRVLVAGSMLAALFMAASGFSSDTLFLLCQRLLAGVASAWVFVAVGLMAARLGDWYPRHSGLLLGIVYGGVGWGIVLSAFTVPAVLSAHAKQNHAWTWAWWWLALACVMAALALIWPARWFMRQTKAVSTGSSADAASSAAETQPLIPIRRFAYALAAYACFGIGYIGYMTFVIALLRDRGIGADKLTWFYALLGVAVVASSRVWAGLLDKAKAARALSLLSVLLGVAVILPALMHQWALMLVSGVLFGAVFLSIVASTTAFVRHHLPVPQWPAGISAFTIVFAFGQIVGPTMVGWLADGSGTLELGLLLSALVLWIGAVLAWMQPALKPSASHP